MQLNVFDRLLKQKIKNGPSPGVSLGLPQLGTVKAHGTQRTSP